MSIMICEFVQFCSKWYFFCTSKFSIWWCYVIKIERTMVNLYKKRIFVFSFVQKVWRRNMATMVNFFSHSCRRCGEEIWQPWWIYMRGVAEGVKLWWRRKNASYISCSIMNLGQPVWPNIWVRRSDPILSL